MAERSSTFLWQQAARILLLTTLLAVSYAVSDDAVVSENTAMNYLSKFGYLAPINPTSGGIVSEEAVSQAISEFQLFAGLNVTGHLNTETSHMMTLPRCGVKDKVGPGFGRSKRYALQGSKWRVKKLTYKISKYPEGLKMKDVKAELRRAFKVWEDVTDLQFIERESGPVHIDIRFERGEHGDGDPFDGRGGTLAHAYFPVYGGDAHFDDAEDWTINSYRGTNLFQVAAHEFGHSLGLSHSDVKAALMAPFYRGYDPAFELHEDDIEGIQALYDKKTISPRPVSPRFHPPTTQTPTEEDSELCSDPRVDTMFNSADGQTYVFKGQYYWKLTADGVAAGYPKLISHSWKGLPGHIDAAFTYKNGKTYFFKGSKYWRYVGKQMDGDYPKEISEGFTGIPDNIDAVTVWTGNGKIYFYKGTKFWRFDPTQKPPVKNSYPKPIANWQNVPDNLDAALNYHSYTYFFKGNSYYRFKDRTFAVDVANPPFPRSTAQWWFGCNSASRGTLGNVQWLRKSPEESFLSSTDITEPGDGDSDDYGKDSDVGDIVLDAGETDEQVVTSSNRNTNSPAAAVLKSSNGSTHLLLTVLTYLIARFLVAT